MERAIQIYAVVNFAIIGLSHALRPRAWAQGAKALVYFAFPAFGLRRMRMPTYERANPFVAAGGIFVLLAALLGFHVASTS